MSVRTILTGLGPAMVSRGLGGGDDSSGPTGPNFTVRLLTNERRVVRVAEGGKMFEIARGDRLPTLRVQLKEVRRNGPDAVVDLSAADSVTFIMTRDRTGRIVTGLATVIDAETGVVEYAWAEGDTDVGGLYIAKFVVVFGGLAMTFPSCPERREFLVEICG